MAFGAAVPRAGAAAERSTPPLGPSTIEWLDWTRSAGAASCASGEAFATAVKTQLGESPASAARRSHHRLAIAIDREGSGPSSRWSAELRLIAADGSIAGTRRIERQSESCAPIIDSLALMASLILAEVSGPPAVQPAKPPQAVEPARPPETLPAPEPVAAPAEPRRTEPQPPPAPPTPPPSPPTPLTSAVGGADATASPARPATPTLRPPRVTVGAGIASSAGLLPKLAAAAEVRLTLALAPIPTLFASGLVWPSQSALITGTESGSTLGLWLAGAGLCPIDHRWRTRAFSACAGGEVGRLHAAGIGFPQPFNQDRWAADLTAGGRLRQTLDGSDFYIALDLRIAVPLLRNRIVFGDANGAPAELFRMWPVAAIGALEVGYAFD